MYPTLLKIGDFTISSWGVMVAIAFLTAYKISDLEFKRKGINKNLLEPLLFASLIGGLVGAKILFLMENVSLIEFIQQPTSYLASGFTFLGGFLGALLVVLLFLWLKKVSFWLIADAIIPATAIGYGIGRIGCFLVGDDYGVPSNLPFAMAFPDGVLPTTVKVHPTQLYESFIMLGVFIILWKLRKVPAPIGWLSSIGFILIGLERFFIEFIRVTTPSPISGLSIAQFMSLAIIAAGLIKIIQIRKAVYSVH
ncbi:MAG: prolipoprotein diacylglyceryl transferase [Thermodesulfobacteriota bacterium]